MPEAKEKGWLPDFLYRDGRFESGVALFADDRGRITRFTASASDLKQAQRLPNRALLPGLVNGHSHTFQRVIRARTEYRTKAVKDTFWTWREAMYHAALRLSPEDIYVAARMAFLEMALTGITAVGEFHYLHHAADGTPYEDRNLLAKQVLRAAGDIGIRVALLRTAYVRAGWKREPDPGQARFITPKPQDFIDDTETLDAFVRKTCPTGLAWAGVAPHSIRAVPLDYLLEVASYAKSRRFPLHMHVAEQPAEVEACLGEYGARPFAFLDEHGILDSRFTAVHAIHIDADEVGRMARNRVTVCACPTTERNLGDGILAAGQLLNAGIAISLGSDSNVQIDSLEDARQLEYNLRLISRERAILSQPHERESLAVRLLQTATEAGAASIGAAGGKLEVDGAADFFTVDLNDVSIAGADRGSLASHIVFALERTAVREVFVNGDRVIDQGRHGQHEQIIQEFAGLQRRLWSK
ncbi:MAG: formimidoylglutamate deiminase [Bryobacteraceae bacterium]|jgi:formimidoylglutamate deiminase